MSGRVAWCFDNLKNGIAELQLFLTFQVDIYGGNLVHLETVNGSMGRG